MVIARASDGDSEKCAFEDGVVRALEARAKVLVVPSVYWMTDADAGLGALRGITGDIVCASWLHPRAAYWLLRARGVEGELAAGESKCCRGGPAECPRTIRTFRFDTFESPEACAEELLKAAGGPVEAAAGAVQQVEGDLAPRWYPVLDYSLCTACAQCHDFCLFGAYSLDEEGRPVVSEPDKCKPGCPACARLCPEGAIMFPQYPGDEGIAGAPGKRPVTGTIDVDAFFGQSREPCPLCGCACDCERSTDGTAPPGKTVCPACGCLCDGPGPCARKRGAASQDAPAESDHPRDDLDDLIDALDELDV